MSIVRQFGLDLAVGKFIRKDGKPTARSVCFRRYSAQFHRRFARFNQSALVFKLRSAEFRPIVSIKIHKPMYRSLSKLLQETQASAAKKLGVLENAIQDEFAELTTQAEQAQADSCDQPFGSEGSSTTQAPGESFQFQDFKIW
jgi:hypothetical protein